MSAPKPGATKGPNPRPLSDRFWEKVDKTGDCWVWTGAKHHYGYGLILQEPGAKPKLSVTHRVSWRLHFGEIPEGMQVLHQCDNPPCVNPSHLRLGTQKDNMAEQRERSRTPLGEQRAHTKLTLTQVREIKRRRGEKLRELGAEFGVADTTIWKIQHGKKWAWA